MCLSSWLLLLCTMIEIRKKKFHRHVCSPFHSADSKQLLVLHMDVPADVHTASHELTVHCSEWRRKVAAARGQER